MLANIDLKWMLIPILLTGCLDNERDMRACINLCTSIFQMMDEVFVEKDGSKKCICKDRESCYR
jgi:hypothetical protein